MTDIVEKLISEQSDGWSGDACCVPCSTADEAAAEITRLRALVEELVKAGDGVVEDKPDLLAELAKHPGWELSTDWEDPDWVVHEVIGGVNDRQWEEIGRGATPAEALAAAIHKLGERS